MKLVRLFLAAACWMASAAQGEPPNSCGSGALLPESGWTQLGAPNFYVADLVQCLAFSPDGSLLAVGSWTNNDKGGQQVQVFDVRTGLPVHGPLEDRLPRMLMFSRDGKRLWSQDSIWETVTWIKKPLNLDEGDRVAALSPDEQWGVIFSKLNNELYLRNFRDSTNTATISLPQHQVFVAAAVSPDCKTYAVSRLVRTLQLYEFSSGKLLHELPLPGGDGAPNIAFSPDGKRLASQGFGGWVYVFDVAAGTLLMTCRNPPQGQPTASGVQFTPDGKFIVAGLGPKDEIAIWDAATGEPITGVPTGGVRARRLAFSPDGRGLAIGGTRDRNAAGSRVCVVDWHTRQELVPPGYSQTPILQLAYSADSRRIAVGTTGGEVGVWDISTGPRLVRLPADGSEHVAFSPDGWLLGATDRNGNCRLWAADASEGYVQLLSHTAAAAEPPINCLKFNRDLTEIALGGADGQVRLCSTASGKLTRSFVAYPSGAVVALAYSPDGKTLATSGGTGTSLANSADAAQQSHEAIQLWDLAKGKLLTNLISTLVSIPAAGDKAGHNSLPHPAGFSAIEFSPDHVAVAGRHGAGTVVWDLSSGEQIYHAADRVGRFSADGSMLLSVRGISVEAIELASGKVCWTREFSKLASVGPPGQGEVPHWNAVPALALAPDGRTWAATVGSDYTVVLSSLAPPEWRPPADPQQRLAKAELDRLWASLADRDAKAAYAAMWQLELAGDQAIEYFHQHSATAAELDANRHIDRLIAELNDDSFEIRERASAELRGLGAAAIPALRQALKASPTLKARTRIEHLLKASDTAEQQSADEDLRWLRMVRVLQRIGTKQAIELLQTLAAGSSARATRAAKAALEMSQPLAKKK